MKHNRLFSAAVAALTLISLTACRGGAGPGQQTPQTVPYSGYLDPNIPAYQGPGDVPTTEPPGDPDLPPLEFNEDAATYLGAFTSEIYGRMTMYYQQDRLVLFDPMGDRMFTLYAEGYKPNGADEREAFLYEETSSDEYEGPVLPDEETEKETGDDEPISTPDFVEKEGGRITGEIELLAGDINFDGYTDFMLRYSRSAYNTYYFCWLWDMNAHTFVYFLPLSSIPSPAFDVQRKRVLSSDRQGPTRLLTTEYEWQNGELVAVGHGEYRLPEQTTVAGGAEDVNASVRVSDGKLLSFVELTANKDSGARWICQIENGAVVRVYSDTTDKYAGVQRITFRGVGVGTTTVVLRYAASWNAAYVAEKILNVSVARDGRITIRVMQ